MLNRPLVPKPYAQPVADMLATIAELRTATINLARLNRRGEGKWPIVAVEAQARAEAWVKELTERVQSRARSAGMDANELMRLTERVLDQRMILPEGFEALEPA